MRAVGLKSIVCRQGFGPSSKCSLSSRRAAHKAQAIGFCWLLREKKCAERIEFRCGEILPPGGCDLMYAGSDCTDGKERGVVRRRFAQAAGLAETTAEEQTPATKLTAARP
jgi:hypothetical protein